MSANRKRESKVERDERELEKRELKRENSHSTPEQFIFQFSNALRDYLEDTYGRESKTHLVDYATATSVFADAFFHIANNF